MNKTVLWIIVVLVAIILAILVLNFLGVWNDIMGVFKSAFTFSNK